MEADHQNMPRNKAERLAIAGAIAPVVRENAEVARTRRVALWDPDTGKVTGYTTVAEVIKGVLARAQIEFDIADGGRREKIVCRACGRIANANKRGVVSHYCQDCKRATCAKCGHMYRRKAARHAAKRSLCGGCNTKPVPHCHDCGAELPKAATAPSHASRRNGEPARCLSCRARERQRRAPPTLKTHCKRGHLRTPENMYGNRTCRACMIERARRKWQTAKVAKP